MSPAPPAGADIGTAPPILVINPNSSRRITEQIEDAVAAPDVKVVRSVAGPPAIETDADVAAAVAPMIETATSQSAAALVVACFSDPGLAELRTVSRVPAVGIAEAAIQAALRVGSHIGVISSVDDSIPRHERYWHELGVADHIAADIPVGLGVLELDTAEAYDRVRSAGGDLLAAGADVVVLGCTGMAHMRARLEPDLGVPVIEPCRAAVAAARSALAGEVS